MFPFRMQDAKDNDAVAFDAIEKFVGKTAREQPAKITVIKRPSFGVVRQQSHCAANFVQQFIAQTRALRFIPCACFRQVRLRIGPDDDAPVHARDGLRSRASTSFQLEPASGWRRYSSSSRSSRAFSSSVAPPVIKSRSSISQIRSKISRRSASSNLGNSAKISILLMAGI